MIRPGKPTKKQSLIQTKYLIPNQPTHSPPKSTQPNQSPNQNKTMNPNKKLSQILNGPSDKAFIKYYEQNIKLKRQLEDKTSYIKQLKQKLQHQLNLNKTTTQAAQLQQLRNEVRKPSHNRPQSSKKTLYSTGAFPGDSKKVESLLEIIQHYKQKLLIAEEQSANLRRQKSLLEQDLQIKTKDRKQQISMEKSTSQNIIQHDQQIITKLKQKVSECQLQKERSKFMEAELRRLQNKLKALELDTDQTEELKVQNRILEERLLKMTMITDSSEGFDKRGMQDKNRELQVKIKAMLEKYNKAKDDKMKLQIQNKLQQNKLIELQHQLQQLQSQNLQLKKNEVNDPVIQKLINKKELLVQVVAQLEKPKPLLPHDTMNGFQNAQKLLLEKECLAKDLIQANNRIRSMEEAWREKETMIKIEKEEMMAQINMLPLSTDKNARYTSKQGVQYDGDISMFSDQNMGTTKGVNYFDIFLGRLSLIETLVRSVSNITSINNPMVMATVDFYNFKTENSRPTQGLNTILNSEFAFKLNEDEFFYRFMTKGTFKISIWAAQGNKNYHLGSAEVPLKQFLLKNKPNVAPVINTSTPIILNQKVIGTIHFDMRMRLPIYEQASHILSQPLSMAEEKETPKRKLIVQIEEGAGFSPQSNLFVYYPFRMEDYYTKTEKGPQPKWGHYKMLEVVYNEEFKNYLRKNDLELTVFDDNANLYDDKDSDVVGTAALSLNTLVESSSSESPIRERVEVRKNGVKVGTIDVKVFWYQSKQSQEQRQEQNQTRKNEDLMESLHRDILKYIRDIGSSAQNEFRKIDSNGTGMISFDQFLAWMAKVKQTFKYSTEAIGKYYDTFPQPLNLINWETKLREITEEEKRQINFMPELGIINQMFRKNSVQINQQVSLRDYMKDKKAFDVSLQIDANRNGIISRQELLNYMNSHNVMLNEKEIEGDEINLLDFLRKYAR